MKDPLVIETKLRRDQVIRLSLLRHIQRPFFFFWAITGAATMAYAVLGGPFIYMVIGGFPLGLYILFGVINALQESSGKQNPYFLPTRYVFAEPGIQIANTTTPTPSKLEWQHFSGWSKMLDCYVLVLAAGPILAIPQVDIPSGKRSAFEELLNRHIR